MNIYMRTIGYTYIDKFKYSFTYDIYLQIYLIFVLFVRLLLDGMMMIRLYLYFYPLYALPPTFISIYINLLCIFTYTYIYTCAYIYVNM
jgi:hypothetical protein